MRASSAPNFSCSLGTSKKPPQLAHARFQLSCIDLFDFFGHGEKHNGEMRVRQCKLTEDVVAVLVPSTESNKQALGTSASTT
jgi:hypothetical protein